MDYKLSVLLIALGLLVGVTLGAVAFPVDKEIIKTEIKTITETVEVEVPVEVYKNHLTDAVDLFRAEFDEDDDLLTCNGYEYDLEDVDLSRLYDAYTVSFDDEEKTVDFLAKLRYKEADRESCRKVWDVSVFYEEDEDPEVSY